MCRPYFKCELTFSRITIQAERKECMSVWDAIELCLPACNCLRILLHSISHLFSRNQLGKMSFSFQNGAVSIATKILHENSKQSSCQKENKNVTSKQHSLFRDIWNELAVILSHPLEENLLICSTSFSSLND